MSYLSLFSLVQAPEKVTTDLPLAHCAHPRHSSLLQLFSALLTPFPHIPVKIHPTVFLKLHTVLLSAQPETTVPPICCSFSLTFYGMHLLYCALLISSHILRVSLGCRCMEGNDRTAAILHSPKCLAQSLAEHGQPAHVSLFKLNLIEIIFP